MTTATVQLPVLFDVSGTATVFGESATTADFISPHLEFTLDMTTEANDISLNFQHIKDAISVGDHEISDTIYYASNLVSGSVDLLANRIAKAITRGKLVHVPKNGVNDDHSNSGIPMGGRPLVAANGLVDSGTPANNKYALKYRTSIAPVNDEQMMGEAMARVAAVHLVGHPLAQAVFKNESTIQDDLETASSQTFSSSGSNVNFYNTFATQLSKVLGGALAATPLKNSFIDPSGQVGQALFEGDALVDAEDAATTAASVGTIVAVPDVSYNIGSTKALYAGDVANTPNGPLYIHDLSAASFVGKANVRSMTFWLRTSGVDASLNIVDNQSIFHAVTKPGDKNVKLQLRDATSDDDRLATFDDHSSTQIAAVSVNGVARAVTHSQGNSSQLGTALTKAEVSGKWNHFYVEFTDGIYPNTISWMADKAATRTKSMLGAHLDEVHYFDKPLTSSEVEAMRKFQTSQLKSNGIELPAVKSMFEQLMNIPGRALDMDSAIEVDGLGSEGARTSVVGMPMHSGDTVVVYIRPKVEFAFESVDITAQNLLGFTGTNLDVSNGSVKDISGLETAGATASTISSVFPGRANPGQAAEANTYGWMGSPNATMIGQESTNITAVNTMDQHIWKISITL